MDRSSDEGRNEDASTAPPANAMFESFVKRGTTTPPRLPEDAIRIRPAALRDVARLAGLLAERQGGTASEHRPGIETFLTRASSGDALFLVAEVDDVVVGFGKAAHFTPRSDASANTAPPGWYLAGVIVDSNHRRRGVATALTRARLEWIGGRAVVAFYFANARNETSIALHRAFGFEETTRDFTFPNASFEGGVGVLFRVSLRKVHTPNA